MALKQLHDKNFRFWFPALLFFGSFLFLRFWGLGDKPYHHDESLYAIESWRYAEKALYQFNPMLHGPFLFHLQALLFKIFPINDFTGRLPVALANLGTLLLGAFVFRQNRLATIIWLALFTFSPIMAYFARFLGMDSLMTFLGILLLVSCLQLIKTKKVSYLYLTFLCISLMYCTKLNSLFYFFAFSTFGILCVSRFPHIRTQLGFLKTFRWHWLGAFVLASIVFIFLFSSMGSHWDGVLDGLYRKMIPYWVKQHSIQRIKGPFHYYIPYLVLYELPLLLILLGTFLYRTHKTKKSRRELTWLLFCFFVTWGILSQFWKAILPFMDKALHMTHPIHLSLAIALVWSVALLVRNHFKKQEFLLAFFAYWAGISFLLYSYAGEKIPWLSVHILLPLLLYTSLTLSQFFRQGIRSVQAKWFVVLLAGMGLGWQALNTYRATHLMSADPRESLVYTHTSWEMLDLVNNIETVATETGAGKTISLQVIGMGAWPLYWYLRDYDRWFYERVEMDREPWIVVHDWKNHKRISNLVGPNYRQERFKLREWWVPDLTKMTVWNAIRYYFTREPFSILGSQDIVVFIRKDLLAVWPQLISGDNHTKAD